VKVLVVGAGRMGSRHLRGIAAAGGEAVVVDPRDDARARAGVSGFATLEEALAAGPYDRAVLAATAAGRLERFQALAAAGVPSILLEKPLEQSRARAHALAGAARETRVDARVNHFFRTLELFRSIRAEGEPFQLSVTGGAFGLACNGIHWLDLALFLAGDRGGRLLYGELDPEPIGSGRGPQFRDYGGRALYAAGERGRLYLASGASSSAPMHAVLDQPARRVLLDPQAERAEIDERGPAVDLPSYRYGAGYERRTLAALEEEEDLRRSTERWLRDEGLHATLDESLAAHDLLFDLLETSGEDHFAIT
jgi:hypothetical protein